MPDALYIEPDGTTLRIDTGYFGTERDENAPTPGPFAGLNEGRTSSTSGNA